MLEIVLRLLAVTISAILLLGFGWYFAFGTDTLQHDWIFFGGGVLSLLSGLAMLPFVVMVFRQLREYGPEGIISDVGYPELAGPPPNVGGAAARAATATAAASDSDSEAESAE
jgi:hypothetical protein